MLNIYITTLEVESKLEVYDDDTFEELFIDHYITTKYEVLSSNKYFAIPYLIQLLISNNIINFKSDIIKIKTV